ncbi:MAG: hypothetical protein K8H84_07800 [Sulfuricella denitrificans]|nr:hypothetical protein [Sulfuricella denitrificans]
MTLGELAQWANLGFIPLLVYIIKLETRLARIEVLMAAEYQFLTRQGRGHYGKEAEK